MNDDASQNNRDHYEKDVMVCNDEVCSIQARPAEFEMTSSLSASTASIGRSGSAGLYGRYTAWLIVAISGVVGWVMLSSRSNAAGYGALAAIIAIVGLRRVRHDRRFSDEGGVQSLIHRSRPVILEFSSELCGACLAVKPAAKQLAAQLGDAARFVDLSVLSRTGRTVAKELAIDATPTFVMFDRHGREVSRGHAPPKLDAVLAFVR